MRLSIKGTAHKCPDRVSKTGSFQISDLSFYHWNTDVIHISVCVWLNSKNGVIKMNKKIIKWGRVFQGIGVEIYWVWDVVGSRCVALTVVSDWTTSIVTPVQLSLQSYLLYCDEKEIFEGCPLLNLILSNFLIIKGKIIKYSTVVFFRFCSILFMNACASMVQR